MKENIFRGLGIALITPFTPDGSVDYDALLALVDRQLAAGIDFLCILGTTAETPCLTTEERKKIKDTIVGHVKGRVPLLLGCGGNNTVALTEEIRRADWTGIDGILSVCPMYNKPTQEGLYRHYAAISEVSPLPIVLYNVPGRTGVNLMAETTIRLARDFHNIVAVKEASGILTQIEEILRHRPAGFDVLSGDDSITLPVIQSGGAGVISVIGNAIPETFSSMVRLARQGRMEEARQTDQRLTELYRLMFVDGNPAGVKAALHHQGHIHNCLRLPLVPATLATEHRIGELLDGLQA